MPRPDASAKLKAARPNEGPSKVIIGAVVVVIVIIAAVVAVIVNDQSSSGGTSGLPKHALKDGGGIVVSEGDKGAPTVDLWEDFQCPFCKHLEDAAGDRFTKLANQGDIRLVVHPLSFLDSNLGNDASTRAANASFCAADADKFEEYHSIVYANQPQQEGVGYTDEQLLQFGKQAGISGKAYDTFEQCVKDGAHEDYVQAVQQDGDKKGIRSTPTVQVNGNELSNQQLNTILQQPQQLDQVLEAAAGK